MEVVKTICYENTPFSPPSTITFDIPPGSYATRASYINVPVKISATSPNPNHVGCIVDPYFDMKIPLSAIIENIGLPDSYTANVGKLTCILAPYLYDLTTSYVRAYQSGIGLGDTYPIGGYSKTFRTLHPSGSIISTEKTAYLRIPLRDLASGFCIDEHTFTDTWQIRLQTSNVDLSGLVASSVPQFGLSDGVAVSENTQTLTDMGLISEIIGNISDDNLFIFDDSIPTYTFGYVPGDSLYVRSLSAVRNIESIVTRDDTVVAITLDGAAIATGADSIGLLEGDWDFATGVFTFLSPIPVDKIPISIGDNIIFGNYGDFEVADVQFANVPSTYPRITTITLDNPPVENPAVGPSDNISPNQTVLVKYFREVDSPLGEVHVEAVQAGIITYGQPTQVVSCYPCAGVFVAVLDRPSDDYGGIFTVPPLYFVDTGLDPIPAGTALTSVLEYDSSSLKLWVGEPVYIVGTAGITPVYAIITSIEFSANRAVITISQPITTGGAVVALYAMGLDAGWTYTVTYPEKWETVNYRKLTMDSDDGRFPKWSTDGGTSHAIPPGATEEYSFILEPGTIAAVIALEPNYDPADPTTQFTSDSEGLLSYRIQIDGFDTTDREIILTGPGAAMKTERLISGFSALDLELRNLSVSRCLFSSTPYNYPIIQEVPLDGASHRLTLTLKAGPAGFSQKILRLFKYQV